MLGHSQWPLMALISRSTNQDDGIRDETWLPVAGCNYAASSTVIHDPDTTAAKLKVEPVVYSYQDDGACRTWADLSIGPQARADRAGEKECSEYIMMMDWG